MKLRFANLVFISAFLAAAAVVVSGCSVDSETRNTPSATSTERTAPLMRPLSSLDPQAGNDRKRCDPSQEPGSMTDPLAGGTLHAELFADMRDLGSRTHATGMAVFNEKGLPASYTVVAGDVEEAIAARFCLTAEELHILNLVRFCIGGTIQPGDVYNLDPYTVVSVGGRKSGICDNEMNFVVPPQR